MKAKMAKPAEIKSAVENGGNIESEMKAASAIGAESGKYRAKNNL
jgi:hypothetical protein